MSRYCLRVLSVAVLLSMATVSARAAWETGTQFRVGTAAGHPCLIDPNGRPFKSVGMVWAYGPERGPLAKPLTVERLTNQLLVIKQLGFNTLNLYGDQFIPETLKWCDENELAVYFRTAYYTLDDFPGDLKDYPDYLDPAFREKAKDYYRKKYIDAIKGHPSVLAIDMDHRWLFALDWGGGSRFDTPKLRPTAVAFFPKWLEARYGDIAKLNAAWGTSYRSFDDISKDERLLKNGVFQKLNNHPARVDVFKYTLWTAEDFLKELAGFLQSKVPGVIVTPTTEHPECIPDVNPDPSTGIAFMSPVHYDGLDDFQRDLPGLCKLIYETRWHYDMQGGPTYISETGFRSSTLEQKPPAMMYAWVVPPTEQTAARCYARQFALMNVLPWMSGYGYFMLYDKWKEGDFGYLRDDGTKKPMAYVGDAINEAFDAAALKDPEPQFWIYYPEYAEASHRPGFQQLKSLVAMWEHPFLCSLDGRIEQYWDGLKQGDTKAGRKFAKAVTKDFRKWWRGFAFTKTIPNDDKPILLFSTVSEILSADDRKALLKKRTLSFGPVGVRDTAMRETEPWYLEALGLPNSTTRGHCLRLNLTNGTASALTLPESQATNSPWSAIPPDQIERAVPMQGQVLAVPAGHYTGFEILAASTEGNAAPFCTVRYTDGSTKCVLGPTIGDGRFKPAMTEYITWNDRYLSRVTIGLQPARELQAIELPKAPWVRMYGVLLVSGGVATNVDVTIQGSSNCTGRTTWWLPLPSGEDGKFRSGENLKVLQKLVSGEPALVASGSHAAFLYDPLTWSDRSDDISRYVEPQQQTIEQAVKYLRGAKCHD